MADAPVWESCGPVVTQIEHPRCVGAVVHTNNNGEIAAVIEFGWKALVVLESNPAVAYLQRVVLYTDSKSAAS